MCNTRTVQIPLKLFRTPRNIYTLRYKVAGVKCCGRMAQSRPAYKCLEMDKFQTWNRQIPESRDNHSWVIRRFPESLDAQNHV